MCVYKLLDTSYQFCSIYVARKQQSGVGYCEERLSTNPGATHFYDFVV